MIKKKKTSGRGKNINSAKQEKRRRQLEDEFEVRLNKAIADSGLCSRRKADELIKEGVVKVNQKVITDLSTKVLPSDAITVKGDPIREKVMPIYILLNKPKDVITSTSDEKGRTTVMDIVRKKNRIYPVGRLDRQTTGALLLTNDGELANRLMHPKYQIAKTYNARLDKELKEEHGLSISQGVELEDGKTQACEVFIHPDNPKKVTLTIREGRNREVRRIFEHFGYDVKGLDRKYYAGLSTSKLKRGEYRHLDRAEVKELKKITKLS